MQISDASIEGKPPSRRSISTWILGAIAFFFFVLTLVSLTLFVVSYIAAKKSEMELERLKGGARADAIGESNAPMTCAWMRECKKTRSDTPPLLVISMDGFANQYVNSRTTPTIKKMGECGGHAEFVYPSFPSRTFPNHYTIATGLYPGTHGIVDNAFYTKDGTKYKPQNGSFYGGEPIWNTVVKNGKVSKTWLWLGSYGKINGVEASFHMPAYEDKPNFISRIDNVTEWLSSDNPPALSMLYLEQPDRSGHTYGPDSDEVREAAVRMDGLIHYVLRKLNEAGILGCTNVVLVSDHGMANIKKRVNLESIDPEYTKVRKSAGNNVLFYGNVSTDPIKCKNGSDYRVYRSKDEVPHRFHYDHDNIGFPYILGNPGTVFVKNDTEMKAALKSNRKGEHGWDNMDIRMQSIFYAIGPSINQNVTLPPFQNTNLYNVFADLMDIPPAPNNGTEGLLDALLVNPPSRANPFEKFSVKPCHNVTFEDCDSSGKFYPSNTTGFISSHDNMTCSISNGRLYLLYSNNRTVAIEILVKKTGSYEGEVVTKYKDQAIGYGCGEGRGGKSSLFGIVPESSLKLTWSKFKSMSLVDRAISKLTNKKNVRMQIGFIYRLDGSTKAMFVTGFWCEGDGWRKEQGFCVREKDTKVESYVIPASAVENFNCLNEDTLLVDYRTSFGDIETLTGLSLLPKSMPLPSRRRISVFIPTQNFD